MILALASTLLTVALPVVLIVWAVRQFGSRTGRSGLDGRSVRRFFQYALLFALVVVVAVGVAGLLELLVSERSLVADDGSALARGLTFTLVGTPILGLLVLWARRGLLRDEEERDSLGWAVYATVAPLTALVVAMVALFDVLVAALSGPRLDGPALARLLVWSAVWLVHTRVAHRTLDEPRRQGLLAVGAVIGLGTSIAGLVWLVGASLDALLVEAAGTLLVRPEPPLARAAATAAVGIPVWVRYWVLGFARSPRATLWFGYVLPLGVGGSLVLAVVGASVVLYRLLVWFVGEPAASQAAEHFDGVPTAVALVVVGGMSLWYHRQVVRGADPGRTEVTRVYEYLMAGVALLAAATGVTLVVVAFVESVLPVATVEVGTSAVNSLLSGVTLLLVGGPLWWAFWSRVGRAARSEPAEELASPTRRIYLFVLFGLGGVAAVVAVLVAAFIGIQGLLQGGFDADVARGMRVSVAVLLATGAVSGYHWAVYRDDRSRAPSPVKAAGPRYVLLVGAPDAALAGAVQRLTGARVDHWVRADGLAGAWVVDDVVAAVTGSPAAAVAVVAGPAGLESIDLRRR